MATAKSRDALILAAATLAKYDGPSWDAFVAAVNLHYEDARDDLVVNVINVQQAQGKALGYREMIQTLSTCRKDAELIIAARNKK